MEIVATCKAIMWICLAICCIVIASMFIASYIRGNKQAKNDEELNKNMRDEIVNNIAKEYGEFVKKTLETEMAKQKQKKKEK